MPIPVNSAPTGRPDSGRFVDVALVNNMPDSALVQTERQFADLLAAGAGPHVELRLRYYTLPGVPRGAEAASRIRAHYQPIESLWAAGADGVIVTGAEPREPVITDEPYWAELVQLLEWSLANTASTIASCLSAHAALHAFDGVRRERLAVKRSGVFVQQVASDELTSGMSPMVVMPHSRLNDVATEAIVGAGYQPLLDSAEVGWTVAANDIGAHRLVLMQGHPEYESTTLLLEYRRDVRRFLTGVRDDYPQLPANCVGPQAQAAFAAFEAVAVAAPVPARTELVTQFPFEQAAASVVHAWRTPAQTLYANWLTRLTSRAELVEVAGAR
jgi:homoserine O-succinyltransferase/O-acetyltransferase